MNKGMFIHELIYKHILDDYENYIQISPDNTLKELSEWAVKKAGGDGLINIYGVCWCDKGSLFTPHRDVGGNGQCDSICSGCKVRYDNDNEDKE